MSEKLNRRNFLTRTGLVSAGLGVVGQAAETPSPGDPKTVAPGSKGAMPMGKIGKTSISRVISGGNLISGWCHQRDLLFVGNLAKAYLNIQGAGRGSHSPAVGLQVCV